MKLNKRQKKCKKLLLSNNISGQIVTVLIVLFCVCAQMRPQGSCFSGISKSFVSCARPKPINNRDIEQNQITKKITQLALLTVIPRTCSLGFHLLLRQVRSLLNVNT